MEDHDFYLLITSVFFPEPFSEKNIQKFNFRYAAKDFNGELLHQCYELLKQRQHDHKPPLQNSNNNVRDQGVRVICFSFNFNTFLKNLYKKEKFLIEKTIIKISFPFFRRQNH